MDLAKEFEKLLRTQLGVELSENLDDVRGYAVDEPGFDEALAASAASVALKVAEKAVQSADEVDQRIVSLVTGALGIAARALAV